ncbi:hypothetical protein EV401DRAFT_2147474 [Pisolithus croceorrhizus]|nr:hypothetical protein EV401DRAFT_2147474 [Pisolithus croceorrhizus]
MRLINVEAFLERERQIKEEGTVDYYAILLHRWKHEVDYLEIMDLTEMENRDKIREHVGYQKIMKSCQQAKIDGLEWLWADTCCIDKRNSTELSEALNSMFQWYENSRKCYTYLHDVDVFPTTPHNETFTESEGWPEWFSWGWMLQELIAPMDLHFFNKDWQYIGDKRGLSFILATITHVSFGVLEDAYSLMGLLDVNMPMLYGEGKKAFLCLQQEVICKSSNQTIFAWNPTGETPQTCGVLADDLSLF